MSITLESQTAVEYADSLVEPEAPVFDFSNYHVTVPPHFPDSHWTVFSRPVLHGTVFRSVRNPGCYVWRSNGESGDGYHTLAEAVEALVKHNEGK